MTSEVRKLIDIIEGRIIPMRKNSIGIPANLYRYYRLFLMSGDYRNYHDTTPAHDDHIFTFYSDIEMKNFKKLLKTVNIPWKDICDAESNKNNEPKDTNVVSPVATNPYAKK